MMNPRNAMPMLDGLLESFRSDRIFKFFHLPMQSGSDSVLSSMNRGYQARELLNQWKD
jgi:tRNA A37 methylthiotransferase MiaB